MKTKEKFEYKHDFLRKLQLKNLEIYEVLLDFCQKNNINIFFCGGCLIGTIRNKGFIPWDDDIDVFMPRDDYEKLKELWPKKGNTKDYELVVPSYNNHTKNQFMTFNDNNTTFIKDYETDLDINHGIRIDLIPIDGCPSSRLKRRIQKIWALTYSLYSTQVVPVKHGKMVTFLGRILLLLVPTKRLRWKIANLAERRMTKYKISDCSLITELCCGPKYMQNEYKKEWFEEVIYKDFEGKKMPIPVGYDGYLSIAYGDYMKLPPKEKRVPEHDVVYCDLNNSYTKYKGKYYCVESEPTK